MRESSGVAITMHRHLESMTLLILDVATRTTLTTAPGAYLAAFLQLPREHSFLCLLF